MANDITQRISARSSPRAIKYRHKLTRVTSKANIVFLHEGVKRCASIEENKLN